jgi:hypothetical protein
LLGEHVHVLYLAGPAAKIQGATLRLIAGLAIQGPDVNDGKGKLNRIAGMHALVEFFSQFLIQIDGVHFSCSYFSAKS